MTHNNEENLKTILENVGGLKESEISDEHQKYIWNGELEYLVPYATISTEKSTSPVLEVLGGQVSIHFVSIFKQILPHILYSDFDPLIGEIELEWTISIKNSNTKNGTTKFKSGMIYDCGEIEKDEKLKNEIVEDGYFQCFIQVQVKSYKMASEMSSEEISEIQALEKLPDLIKITATGEEDETEMFVSRAKLYIWKESKWMTQGLGDIKILFNEKQNRFRLVMRREEVFTICCNLGINNQIPEATFKSESDKKTVCFGGIDFSSETGISGTFTIRLKTEKAAASFLKAFNSVRDGILLSENLFIEHTELN